MKNRRPSAFVHFAAATAITWAIVAGAAARQMPAHKAGERFYVQGLAGDAAVPAIVQQDIRVLSSQMPCINCHRRSGWGTAEGPVVTPPVVGAALFAAVSRGIAQMGTVKTTGPGTRPAYTEESLLRAIRDGVDPAGRTLSATMPRYAISDATAADLSAYLRTLSGSAPAGVTTDSLHLATITTPDVSAARRASMLGVLKTYVRHKNANTRNETGRRDRGPWDMARHAAKYRSWVLHEWALRGIPSEWPAQLAALYRQQPVFAVVSGISDGDWSPIHAFAEQAGIPVILPQLAIAPENASSDAFYSMYFSKGLGLEVELLAQQLRRAKPPARVLQVSRCGTAGHTAAKALSKLFPAIASGCVDLATALSRGEWERMLADHPETILLWLGPADLNNAVTGDYAFPASVTSTYVSSTLLGERIVAMPIRLAERALVLHPFVVPEDFDRHASRALSWLKANALAPADRAVAINALFAASLVNDAVSHPRTLESREYFIERLEHLSSRSPHRSTYPAIALGPRRRFASAGGYILKAPSASGAPFGKVTEWFLP